MAFHIEDLLENPFGLNQNLKSLKLPDGMQIDFQDDAAIFQNLQNAASANVPNLGQRAVQQTGKPLTGASQEQGGGFGDFLNSPAFSGILGQLAQAFSATSPRSPQFQIGGLFAQRAQSQLFQKLLEGLSQSAVSGGQSALGGQGQQNPNIPAGSSALKSFELAGLPPEMILQAVQFAEGQRQFDTQADVAQSRLGLEQARTFTGGVLDLARARALNAPSVPGKRNVKIIDMPVDNQGNIIDPGQVPVSGSVQSAKFEYDINTQQLARIGPGLPTEKADKPTKQPPSQKPATVNLFRETLITQFGDAILEGLKRTQLDIDPKSGDKIVSVSQMLSLLKDPLSGFSLETAETALAAVPDAFADYNKRLESALIEVDQGKNIGTILREQRSSTFQTGPKPTRNFGANAKRK